jgi:hypothetical protein
MAVDESHTCTVISAVLEVHLQFTAGANKEKWKGRAISHYLKNLYMVFFITIF